MNRLLWQAAVAVALLGAVVGSYWFAFQAGQKAGRSEIQARWNEDTARRETSRLEALARFNAEMDRQRRISAEVENALTQKLDAADARGRDLARRLRLALSEGICPTPAGGSTPGPTDGAGAESDDPAAIGAALADHLAACEQDAERLTSLQRWVGEIRREPTAR